MNANLTAAIANQRYAELIAEAEARRVINALRQDRRSHRASSRHSSTLRLRRRPFTALQSWYAAGQL